MVFPVTDAEVLELKVMGEAQLSAQEGVAEVICCARCATELSQTTLDAACGVSPEPS